MKPEQIAVIARTSVMPYKHTSKRADEIARELGVECLLEGSVRGENGSVRMRAQLIRAGNKTQL